LKLTKTKYENNWKEKTLKDLEEDYWGEPTIDSHLVKSCHSLRKKPIKDFEIEDLRLMIGHNIGLKFLIPVALDKLSQNILAEGDFYEGDLLKSVLTCKKEFWISEKKMTKYLKSIISDNQKVLEEREPDLLEIFMEWKKK